ncbi:hypothetical protein OAL85_01365 [Methylophilaceae bacterium]|jgi:hypothetical protein|nr:hypothetical protein [Methylophilaceae bacterium]|tara:strand:- start:79 stop:573 length:495 start_codon:yes stop_codon:yes gene_type:complete
MVSNFNKTLIIIGLFISSIAYSEVKSNEKSIEQQKINDESGELQKIHDALTKFSQSDDKNSIIYQQKLREMLDSVEIRFHACDPDNDNTLDVYETTVCLPQVARQFRQVDINNDNVISLDELSILARNFAEKIKSAESLSAKDLNVPSKIISEKQDEIKQESPL